MFGVALRIVDILALECFACPWISNVFLGEVHKWKSFWIPPWRHRCDEIQALQRGQFVVLVLQPDSVRQSGKHILQWLFRRSYSVVQPVDMGKYRLNVPLVIFSMPPQLLRGTLIFCWNPRTRTQNYTICEHMTA